MTTIASLFDSLVRPPLFYRGTTNFWNDPHISEQLLKAHLDPHVEGASRKPEFIGKSVDWITAIAPPIRYPDLLDLGCGPGLYAEQLHDRGYRTTGIDFSRRSLAYAQQRAKETGRAIEYRYGSYMEMGFREAFDLAILIYCDYGALSPEEGARLLFLIHQSLRPGGKLLLDVFTHAKMATFNERRAWEYHENGGFWQAGPHIAIYGDCVYDTQTTLEQTVVVSRQAVQPYFIWHRYFNPEMLVRELGKAGFRDSGMYGDAAGAAWSSQSETLMVVAEK